MSEHPLHELAMAIRYDLTAAQGKLTELLRAIGELDLPHPDQARCSRCGLVLAGPNTLAEHVHTSHGGPVPAHWLAVDALVAEPVELEAVDEGQYAA